MDWQSIDFMLTLYHAFFYIVHFLCMDFFFGIISIMFVIGCIRLEGGVLDSYYVSCYRPPARPLADREASA